MLVWYLFSGDTSLLRRPWQSPEPERFRVRRICQPPASREGRIISTSLSRWDFSAQRITRMHGGDNKAQIRQVLALCNITSGNFTNFTKINSFFWICFGASVGKVLQALPNPLIFYFLTCSQGTFHCTTTNQSIYNLSKEEKFEELCIVNCGLDYI